MQSLGLPITHASILWPSSRLLTANAWLAATTIAQFLSFSLALYPEVRLRKKLSVSAIFMLTWIFCLLYITRSHPAPISATHPMRSKLNQEVYSRRIRPNSLVRARWSSEGHQVWRNIHNLPNLPTLGLMAVAVMVVVLATVVAVMKMRASMIVVAVVAVRTRVTQSLKQRLVKRTLN